MLFFAIFPIIWLFIGLVVFKKPAHKVCFSGLIMTIFIALIFFAMPFLNILEASWEGTIFAFWNVILVISGALFTYLLAMQNGSFDLINKFLNNISQDKRIQVLLIIWGFGCFLEAVAGNGIPIAIPAVMLIGIGFKPLKAIVLALIANTITVSFAGIAVPLTTLASTTGLDVNDLSKIVVIQTAVFTILIPFILVMVSESSFKAIKGVFWISFAAGMSYLVSEVIIVWFVGPQLAALIPSIVSLATIILVNKFLYHKNETEDIHIVDLLKAWSPYIAITFLVVCTSSLFPTINNFLTQFQTNVVVYSGENPNVISFTWLVNPAVLIWLAAIIGIFAQNANIKQVKEVGKQTLRQMKLTSITVISILAISKIMVYSGMVSLIAMFLSTFLGMMYPFFSPLIGSLGTFITGSTLSSNVLFGQLQNNVATNLNINNEWIVAANSTGASIGKMISLQNIAVGCLGCNMVGQEGVVLKEILKYFVLFIVISGLITMLGVYILL